VKSKGTAFTFRAYLTDTQGNNISPWHDVPLKAEGADTDEFTVIYEIARDTTPKMEVATDEVDNPIKQDTKKDKKSGEL